jgi:hypothetical protein
MRNAELVTKRTASEEPGTMPHPQTRPGPALSDFFLFRSVQQKLIITQSETAEALLLEVKRIIPGIPGDLPLRVFAYWQRRSARYCELADDYSK